MARWQVPVSNAESIFQYLSKMSQYQDNGGLLNFFLLSLPPHSRSGGFALQVDAPFVDCNFHLKRNHTLFSIQLQMIAVAKTSHKESANHINPSKDLIHVSD